MAWLVGWERRLPIIIDKTDITNALTDFPVLIYLSSSSGRDNQDLTFVFDELQTNANRFKIAVTTENGVSELYVEIEEWDDANELAWLWVKVPAVTSAVNTGLYLYYDVEHDDNTNYVGDPNSAVAENVWDINHVLVTHMIDDPDVSNVRDSTTNDNDGAKEDANEPIEINGQIYKGQSFDNVDDYIRVPDHATLDVIGQITLSMWLNPTVDADFLRIINKRYAGGARTYDLYLDPTNHVVFRYGADGVGAEWKVTSAATIANGVFSRVAAVFDGVNLKIIINGTQDINTNTAPDHIDSTGDDVFIGAYGVGDTIFHGVLDEVRISNTGRAVAWAKASYESGRDDLLAFGRVELAPIERGTFPLPHPPRRRQRRFTYTLPLSVTVRKTINVSIPIQVNIRVPYSASITSKRDIRENFTESFIAKRPIVTQEFKRLLERTRSYLEEE